MTAQDAFRNWMISNAVLASFVAVALGVAVFIVVVSSSRKRQD